ncbi:WxPxxD family membrane protein [Peribacillus frigoritolerans]|uniref:WxPxxD family membrane protein n=1 Tax=Peribacillus frigoritolerans TaxID=450367 RepID=UPI00227DB2FB|nr:WxPxxD family membrane protein [Peribacillus frigoritolerans]MCP1094942.1 WxPxxD family membrane protein [Bacillaceae bacterium OS4b]MCY9140027.1 WxPxxD family membrane protein [Peribacillus frigoritolerans]
MKSNQKKVYLSMLLLLLFGCLWMIYNIHYLKIKQADPSYPLIIDVSGSVDGYLSIKNLLVTYIIPLLLFYRFFIEDEHPQTIVRLKSRMHLYRRRTIQVFKSSFIYSFCILTINFAGVFIFDRFHFLSSNYWNICLLNLALLTCIYFSVGMLYYFIFDFSNSIIAMAGTFCICFLLYLLNSYLNVPWTPASALNIIDPFLSSGISGHQSLIMIGKELLLSIVMILIGQFAIEKKDFIIEVSND